MKEGADFHSPPPPNDPHDPLLAALRQHLGENFGQEPPAALWAGIRQQLPGAPRPWWRSRRLLPLLALLVGIVALGVFSARQNGWLGGQLATRSATHSPATGARLQAIAANKKASTSASPAAGKQATGRPLAAATAPTAVAPSRTTLGPQAGLSPTAATLAAAGHAKGRAASSTTTPTGSEQPLAATHELAAAHAGEATAALEPGRRHLATLRRAQRHTGTSRQQRAGSLAAQPFAEALGTPAPPTTPSAAGEQATFSPAKGVAASGSTRKRSRRRPARTTSLPADFAAASLGTGLGPSPTTSLSRRSARAAPSAPAFDAAVAGLPTALDSLAGRQTTLLLTAPSLPTALAPTADTPTPWLPPARRWSVLVLAGPTLSFRTVHSATPGGLVTGPATAIPSPTQSYFSSSGSRASSANVVDLERPAAGLGAQVQVRRVLAGRWALAFGAGYQEYATRLALQVTKRYVLAQPLPTSNVSYTDSSFSVHHRDTYQLVTLPLQLSYLLAPHGRLSLGLLGGLEPSLYVGGRTTEGTSCNCEQQSFSSASGSPYASFSLGLSLGLDARYRLGGPASRWQWVLQPTGRYIASPFVRSNTLFARRQPYSLGLLTGLAWEF